MADSEQSKIRYDDFIAAILPDPAKPESTIMLAGFIGHGADGQVRLYPDPSLGTWYDLPEGDVVHSIPIPDSKLGGSYVWVRATADIKPGSTSTSSTATGGGSGDAAAAAAAPAAQAAPNFTIGAGCTFICAQPGGGLHPTPTAQPTPATHCFICPPLTQDCTVATACSQQCTTPLAGCLPVQTAATACTQHCTTPLAGCLPVQTAATVCTQNCTTPLGGCLPLQPTPATHCFICPPHQTLDTLCTLPHCVQPTPTVVGPLPWTPHCPSLLGCLTRPIQCLPHSLPAVCTIAVSPNCPPPPPGTPVQQPFVAAAAIQPTPTVQTLCFVCPPITQQCSAATLCSPFNQCGHHPTAATICSETCNTQLVGCWHTLPAICIPITQPQICNIAVSPNCPPPPPGTPVQQGQQQFAAAAAIQPTPTVQTHCFVCPPITLQQQCVHPTLPAICGPHTVPPACPHQTMGMFCTELCQTLPGGGCWPTALVICHPSLPQNCTIAISPNCPGPGPGTPVQQPFAAAAAIQPTPSAVNQCGVHTAATVCTQPVACQPSVVHICPTPSAVHQCGPHTVATVCTQPPACHPSVNMICPTPSAVHQCGQPSVNVICPTPSAVHQCGAPQAPTQPVTVCACTQFPICHAPPTFPPACPVHTVATACTQPPGACGVFTPFCPQ
jgi:hypothetical protein